MPNRHQLPPPPIQLAGCEGWAPHQRPVSTPGIRSYVRAWAASARRCASGLQRQSSDSAPCLTCFCFGGFPGLDQVRPPHGQTAPASPAPGSAGGRCPVTAPRRTNILRHSNGPGFSRWGSVGGAGCEPIEQHPKSPAQAAQLPRQASQFRIGGAWTHRPQSGWGVQSPATCCT